MERQEEILKGIAEYVMCSDSFDVGDVTCSNFIWIKAQNGFIGHESCHYEFIFQEEDPEHLSLEVHFKEKKRDGRYFDSLKLPIFLEFSEDWRSDSGFRRIIFSKDEYYIEVDDKDKVKDIVKKAIKLLEKLDNAIGLQLREIVESNDCLKPAFSLTHSLSEANGKIVNSRDLPERKYSSALLSQKHGKIQEKLITQLEDANKYLDVGYERTLGNIRVDVLGIDNNFYDIYEVKPFNSPTECIREALGQLLFYNYCFAKSEYRVEKLFVAGPSPLNEWDEAFLQSVKELCPSIDYIQIL